MVEHKDAWGILRDDWMASTLKYQKQITQLVDVFSRHSASIHGSERLVEIWDEIYMLD